MKFLWNILPQKIINLLSNRQNLRKVLANINWLAFEKICNMFLGVLVGAWVARYLGPGKFGQLSYATSFVSLFSFLSTLGLNQVAVRDLVKNEDEKEEILGTVFFLKIIGSLLMNVLTIVTIYFFSPGSERIKIYVAIVSFGYLFKPFDAVIYWFRSQVESKYAVFGRLSSRILIDGARVLLILLSAPLIAFIAIVSLNFCLTAIGLTIFYQMYSGASIFRWDYSRIWAKTLISDSLPLLLSGAAVTIHSKIDQVMIGNMVDEEALGIYAAAARLKKWGFVAVVISNSVFPVLIETNESDQKLYRERLQKLYDWLIWLGITFTVGVSVLSGFIIWGLYGAEYAGAQVILIVLSGEIAINYAGIITSKILVLNNHTELNLYRTIIGASLNIGLNLLLIPKYGIFGSAVATLLSIFIQDFLAPVLFGRSRHLFFMTMKSFNPIGVLRRGLS